MIHRPRAGAGPFVVVSTALLAAVTFVACGGSSSHSAAPPVSTSATLPSSAPSTSGSSSSPASPTTGAVTGTTLPDVTPTAASFVNINTMARVGEHFVGSLNGHLAAALAVARSKTGGVYPVGTVIQLIPTEAMVKRHEGYSPSTGDWEFFSLAVSASGTQVKSSGAKVKNFFGGDCASCHRAAAARFDFICGKNHGCAPLPLTDALIAKIQRNDPRPKR